MFNYKIFIFNELNYLLLPIAIFQKIIGREVYFLRLTKSWQNEKSIKFFQFIGLKWLNFQDYKIEKIAYLKHHDLLEDLAENIFNMIFRNKLVKKINLKIEKLDILKKTKSVGIEVSKSKV